MKKILFFSFFLTILFSQLFAVENKSIQKFIGCDNEIDEDYFINYSKIKIKKIEIDVSNYKKWTVNNIKILTNPTRFTPNKLKINFKGDVKVTYEDNSVCFFKARIRHSGDAKDHISLKENSVIQSIDVRLKNGNIRGITKFKLFKPNVRGNLEDVVIQTQILRDFGYLAPRSIKVDARVNETESIMLFQEKSSKELLEFNNRREGPILEGDQKFFFELVKDIPDSQLSNWSVGTPFLRNKSSKVMLSKLTNANLINRGEVHKEISLSALNNLNLIYLYWSNRFQDKKNNFFFFDYDLDNTLLSFFNPNKIIELDTYNLFMQSTNSQHALSASNRKFYWNSIENYFEPILYDANPNIDLDFSTTTTTSIRYPISDYFDESFDNLAKKLLKIDIDNLYEHVTVSGLDLSKKDLKKKLNKINKNLTRIKNNFYKNSKKEEISYNNFKPIDNILSKFNANLSEIDPSTYLIKHDGNKLLKCEIYLENCQFYEILNKDLVSLLEGELEINNIKHQYIGRNFDLNNLNSKNKYRSQKFLKSKILYEDGIDVYTDIENNILKINQTKVGSRAYLINSQLKDTTIIFNGINIVDNNNENSKISVPRNYPIDSRGLTGCLSLINMDLKNISIIAKNSSCEDTVNFINSSGTINKVIVQNSFSDALDVDYSNLKFNYIEVSSALNDCTDFSSGQYELLRLKLNNCGDKGISIGEKSTVKIKTIDINKAEIGIATKDSSILRLNDASLKNLNTCVSAYNKKQEFQGGFIKMKNLKCENYINQFDTDKLSKVLLNDTVQNNSN